MNTIKIVYAYSTKIKKIPLNIIYSQKIPTLASSSTGMSGSVFHDVGVDTQTHTQSKNLKKVAYI